MSPLREVRVQVVETRAPSHISHDRCKSPDRTQSPDTHFVHECCVVMCDRCDRKDRLRARFYLDSLEGK